MDRLHRPIGLTALALASVAVGMYAQLAAMALILGSLVFGMPRAGDALVPLLLSVAYLAIMLGAYLVAFGFWTQRSWAHGAGIAVYVAFIAGNVVLAFVALDPTSAIATGVGAAVGLAYLVRTATTTSLVVPAVRPRADQTTTSDPASFEPASSSR